MAQLNVNPTRMELTRLKKSLATAQRGHKLLKDKRDEMMRQFLEIINKNKTLREKVEKKLSESNKYMAVAESVMMPKVLMSALLMPKQSIDLEIEIKNIMNVDIPKFNIKTKSQNSNDIYSYGYAFTSYALDKSVSLLSELLPDMLRLAECEKSAQLLADEIEKTRRRVNALEYVMIPNYSDTIKYITMKLDENERSNTARLMKIKDMMIEKKFEIPST